MKRILFAAAALAAVTGVGLPTVAMAQVSVNLVIGNAPPPPRSERVPPPRRGYIWAPGYWIWTGAHHEWTNGHWELDRPGYIYHPAQWRQDRDGWHFIEAGFEPPYVEMAPPPLRVEAMPAPRRGYLWAPGHWEWQRNRHIWIDGVWLRERPGYYYQPHSWVQRDGRWVMEGGQWSRGEAPRHRQPNEHEHEREHERGHDRYPDESRRN